MKIALPITTRLSHSEEDDGNLTKTKSLDPGLLCAPESIK
jgi:hypothetical protein